MEPIRNSRATLVDLLDRILEKGLVINADIIISVAGIPLIGISLRAALAGMETMLKYGVMQAWDEKSRAWETKHRKLQKEAQEVINI
ncbi:MAG: gas vesicle protein [Acidobacteriota bacterium]